MFDFLVGLAFIIIVCKVGKAIYDERDIISVFRRKNKKDNQD